MSNSELLLGVDIGTASTKGVLARPNGEILGISERPQELSLPHPGWGERVVAVGGGTKGGLWTQIISDVTGISQKLPEQTVGACYGDAMLAGSACGLLDHDARWTSMADTVEPNPDNQAIYDELYGIYRDLYPATRPMAHALANIQTREDTALEEAPT